jgi:hypothetical protein
VEGVSQKRWHQPSDPRQSPRPPEAVKHSKDGRRVLPTALTVHQQQRLQTIELQTCLCKQVFADGTLDRGVPEHASAIVSK